MKFLILSENSNGEWPHLHYRSMGSFELRRRIELKNHVATIVDWFSSWEETDLKNVATGFFQNEPNPVIALSTPFDTTDVYKIKPFLEWAKEQFPNLTIIHGGGRVYDPKLSSLIDVFFLGRSMEMFDAWISDEDLTKYIRSINPLVLVNHNFNEKIDNPVVPPLADDDFLTHKDILGFEIGVGCKFNCSFCNYELRNAKITKLADVQQLRDYFELAYKKYGVRNFFASDDTLNESDEKLEIVAEALSGLDFHPEITAFARLDIMAARKSQLDLIKRIKFRSLFFGIESFNPDASKAVRKKSSLGNTYEALTFVRDHSPETYTVGGLIIGLNGDSKKSIYEAVDKVISENLLKSIQFYPLSITKPSGIIGEGFYSDLDKNPEQFGYKTTQVIKFHHGNTVIPSYEWESDWTNSKNAQDLTTELFQHCAGKIDNINHLDYAGLHALGVYKPSSTYQAMQNKSFALSRALKQSYISKKVSQFSR